MNYKLKAGIGSSFMEVAKQAKSIACRINEQHVEFDFNRVRCIVSKETNLDFLQRDFLNSFTMNWKEIGPTCAPVYEAELQAELDKCIKLSEQKAAETQKAYKIRDAQERKTFEAKTKGVELEIKELGKFNEWKSRNTDEYGAGIFDYAESWGKLMQIEIAKGKPLKECAEPTSFQLGFLGITGYMYGAAVAILSSCWKHGEDLRRWHNKEYGHVGSGVVNPAILTVN